MVMPFCGTEGAGAVRGNTHSTEWMRCVENILILPFLRAP